MESNKSSEGRYIYGIIRSSDKTEFITEGIGARKDKVYSVPYKDISAVISASPVIDYQARRVNMIAHQKVLEEVMKSYGVLPVRFSTISPYNNDEEIIKILSADYSRFDDLLKKMKDRKELGLKVVAVESKIYEKIIQKYDKIRIMRDKLINKPSDKIHYQRVKIGEMVAESLKNEIEEYKRIILDYLKPLSQDIKVSDNYGDLMILNAAFLINEEKEKRFDDTLSELDKLYGDIMTFKYVGTLPPYNFVNLTIKKSGD
jgi:hypothetical protein